MAVNYPGIQRIIDSASTTAPSIGTAPTSGAAGIAVRKVDNHAAAATVRASTDYLTSTASTNTSDVQAYGGVVGMVLSVDQTAVSASSGGGGTGTMTHTVQVKDPIGATYTSSTAAITTTTGVATFILNCYPGMATVASASGAVGKADFIVPNTWRVQSSASSSATNFTYSIAAMYIPTTASSS